jgi:hypothetical protein
VETDLLERPVSAPAGDATAPTAEDTGTRDTAATDAGTDTGTTHTGATVSGDA